MSTPSPHPATNYIFVDFENVPQIDLAILDEHSVHLVLLLGAKTNKLEIGLVEKLIEHSAAVQLIRLASSGNNALDFTLAYYVGRMAAADPKAWFHVVSRDTGFDPLIEHLQSRHLKVRRHSDFSTFSFSVAPKAIAEAGEDLMSRVLLHLKKNANSRPRRRKTLISHLVAFAGKNSTEAEVIQLVENLIKADRVRIDEKNVVTYKV